MSLNRSTREAGRGQGGSPGMLRSLSASPAAPSVVDFTEAPAATRPPRSPSLTPSDDLASACWTPQQQSTRPGSPVQAALAPPGRQPTPPSLKLAALLASRGPLSDEAAGLLLADLGGSEWRYGKVEKHARDTFATFMRLCEAGRGAEARRNVNSSFVYEVQFDESMWARVCAFQLRNPEASVGRWGEGPDEFLQELKTLAASMPPALREALAAHRLRNSWPADPFGARAPVSSPELRMPASVDEYPAYFEAFNMAPSPAWRPGPPLGRDACLGEIARYSDKVSIHNPLPRAITVQLTQGDTTRLHVLGPGQHVLSIAPDGPCKLSVTEDALFLNPSRIYLEAPDQWGGAPPHVGLNLAIEPSESPPVVFPPPEWASPSVVKNTPAVYGSESARRPMTQQIPRLLQSFWIGSILPQDLRERLVNFRRLNPDHTMVLWTDRRPHELTDEIRAFCVAHGIKLVNVEHHADVLTHRAGVYDIYKRYEQHREPVPEADVLRAVFSQTFGGTYSDCDLHWYQPLRWFTEHYELVLVGRDKGRRFDAPFRDAQGNNDFFMTVPNHPYWEHVLAHLREAHGRPVYHDVNRYPFSHKDQAVLSRTGPDGIGLACDKFLEACAGTPTLDGVVFLAPAQVGMGYPRRAFSIAHGEAGASGWPLYKRKELEKLAVPFVQREDTDVVERLTACFLDDLRDFGVIYLDVYAPELKADPPLKDRVFAKLLAVLEEGPVTASV